MSLYRIILNNLIILIILYKYNFIILLFHSSHIIHLFINHYASHNVIFFSFSLWLTLLYLILNDLFKSCFNQYYLILFLLILYAVLKLSFILFFSILYSVNRHEINIFIKKKIGKQINQQCCEYLSKNIFKYN